MPPGHTFSVVVVAVVVVATATTTTTTTTAENEKDVDIGGALGCYQRDSRFRVCVRACVRLSWRTSCELR